jgi:transposase
MSRKEEASREELIRIIEAQQKVIAELQARIAVLERRIKGLQGEQADEGDEGTEEPVVRPGKPKRSPRGEKPRKKRSQGYGRGRSKPTRQVRHALVACRRCGCAMRGGWVKRRREVLHIPVVQAEVIEHVFIERRCPRCGTRQTAGTEVLAGEVLGHHRVSVQTMAMIATLREEGRLPLATIQWILQAFYGLELGVGELVEILHAVAHQGREKVQELQKALRSSPVVHADETTWREDGENGYFWSFSTPRVCYMQYSASRSGQMVDDVLGQPFYGTLVTDFYAGYNRHEGVHQRCWVHLLRDIHALKEAYPDHEAVQVWGKAIYTLYQEACRCREKLRDQAWTLRYQAMQRFQSQIVELCQPFLDQEVPQRVLCQRIQRFLGQLFTFVVDPNVPPDNNAAERAVRPLAVCRKISGGTRSPRGTETKGILASLFATWRLQALNPFLACSHLLAAPQL